MNIDALVIFPWRALNIWDHLGALRASILSLPHCCACKNMPAMLCDANVIW